MVAGDRALVVSATYWVYWVAATGLRWLGN